MKVVHLFDRERGSRYPLMINQGLIASNRVSKLTVNQDVVSLGDVLLPASAPAELMKACQQADLVFRPSRSHFSIEGLSAALLNQVEPERIVYYDFNDWPLIDYDVLDRVGLYVKRTPLVEWEAPGLRKLSHVKGVYYAGYCVLDEYTRAWVSPPFGERNIDILCLFHTDLLKGANPAEDSRRTMLKRLLKWRGNGYFLPGTNIIAGNQTTRTGRRAIFDDLPGNPFWDYLHLLKFAKIVITPVPDHGGGDNRLWEAFAAGALVVSNLQAAEPHLGFVPDEHYIDVDPLNPDSLAALLPRLHELLAGDERRKGIAQAGRQLALAKHSPADRINGILSAVSSSKEEKTWL